MELGGSQELPRPAAAGKQKAQRSSIGRAAVGLGNAVHAMTIAPAASLAEKLTPRRGGEKPMKRAPSQSALVGVSDAAHPKKQAQHGGGGRSSPGAEASAGGSSSGTQAAGGGGPASGADVPIEPRIKAVFLEVDIDRGGSLDVSELMQALRKLGMKKTAQEVMAVLAKFDGDGSRSLDMREFQGMVLHLEQLDLNQQIRKAFDHFDKDGSGDIDAKELRGALKHLGIAVDNVAGIDAILKQYSGGDGGGDDDDDGLTFEDFTKLVHDIKRLQHSGSGDVSLTSLTEKEGEGEDEYDEEGNLLPKSWHGWLFLFLIALFTVLMDFVLDALSGGSCMVLLPMLFSLGWYIYGEIKSHFFPTTYWDGEGVAPPAPPTNPSVAQVMTTRLFDYAEAEPVIFLTYAYGITTLIALFFLFLKDMENMVAAVTDEQTQMLARGEPSASFATAAYALLSAWLGNKSQMLSQRLAKAFAPAPPAPPPGRKKSRMWGSMKSLMKNKGYTRLQEEGGGGAEGDSGAADGGAAGGGGGGGKGSPPISCRGGSTTRSTASSKTSPRGVEAADLEVGRGGGGGGGGGGGAGESPSKPGAESIANLAELQRELRQTVDMVDELDARCKVLKKSTTSAAVSLRARVETLKARRSELMAIVEAAGSAQKDAKKRQAGKKKEALMTKVMNSTAAKIAMNAMNGIMTVSIYFADLMSDVQVIMLLLTPPPPPLSHPATHHSHPPASSGDHAAPQHQELRVGRHVDLHTDRAVRRLLAARHPVHIHQLW
jgi:Ca2+-binding EF-hand superfamily protein